MIEADVDTRLLERGLADLARNADHAGPFFRELVPELRVDQRDHDRQKEGPDGPWPGHAAATAAKNTRGRGRRKRRRKLLGRLPRAVRYGASADEVSAESRVRWSGVHQHGGRAGNGANIPARPFLWFSEEFLADVAGALAKYTTKDWSKVR